MPLAPKDLDMDNGDPAARDGRNGKATRARFSGLDAAHLRYAIKNYDSAVSNATTKLSKACKDLHDLPRIGIRADTRSISSHPGGTGQKRLRLFLSYASNAGGSAISPVNVELR